MNERLKQLRKELSLNQVEMAEKMKLSRSHISSLENGAREITDRIIYTICREFNLNEEWLRNGTGEMFIENDSMIIAELANEYHLDSIDQKIIEYYVKLDDRSRKMIKEHVVSLAKQITSIEETTSTVELDPIEAELESYRRELEAEKKIRTSSASQEKKGKSS